MSVSTTFTRPWTAATWTTTAERTAVRRLRRFAGDFARTCELPESLVDPLQVIVSEYATNAVCHSGSPDVSLLLALRDRLLLVAVRDRGTWRHPRPRGPEAAGGRGLVLVRAYSHACGRHRSRTGTHAWAHLAVPATQPEGTR
ncbi:ATP-binding protein [Streptomyces sp. NPDC092296]|uniref:ATP-binding protein n=1 Tax=Streptomyces sp. NPDC092296 TaxID=3366012 RepID=UPI0037F216A5